MSCSSNTLGGPERPGMRRQPQAAQRLSSRPTCVIRSPGRIVDRQPEQMPGYRAIIDRLGGPATDTEVITGRTGPDAAPSVTVLVDRRNTRASSRTERMSVRASAAPPKSPPPMPTRYGCIDVQRVSPMHFPSELLEVPEHSFGVAGWSSAQNRPATRPAADARRKNASAASLASDGRRRAARWSGVS